MSAQPCQHKRQKWAINMRTGSCSDCGATFVFGRDGNPESWSAPPAALAAPPQPVPLTDEQIDAGIEAWFTTDITTNEGKDKGHPFRQRMRAAIERAHGIGGKS